MLHLSAAAADWDSYFSLFTEDAGFIGTDITEHWTMGIFSVMPVAVRAGAMKLGHAHWFATVMSLFLMRS
nr:nuclear transport factor 2 family protein [Shewanella dokdonensis]